MVAEPATGWQPLHWAAELWRPALVRMLIEAGADPNVTDHGFLRPMDFAFYADQSGGAPRLFAHADSLPHFTAFPTPTPH